MSKCVVNNKYKGQNIFITDDVTPKITAQRKELREMHLRRIQRDDRVYFAFIPWSVPEMIRYKVRDGPFKSFRLGSES